MLDGCACCFQLLGRGVVVREQERPGFVFEALAGRVVTTRRAGTEAADLLRAARDAHRHGHAASITRVFWRINYVTIGPRGGEPRPQRPPRPAADGARRSPRSPRR